MPILRSFHLFVGGLPAIVITGCGGRRRLPHGRQGADPEGRVRSVRKIGESRTWACELNVDQALEQVLELGYVLPASRPACARRRSCAERRAVPPDGGRPPSRAGHAGPAGAGCPTRPETTRTDRLLPGAGRTGCRFHVLAAVTGDGGHQLVKQEVLDRVAVAHQDRGSAGEVTATWVNA